MPIFWFIFFLFEIRKARLGAPCAMSEGSDNLTMVRQTLCKTKDDVHWLFTSERTFIWCS